MKTMGGNCRVIGLLFILIVDIVTSNCPTTCSCGKWKSGKETSDCSYKDFHVVPEGIPRTTQVFHLDGNKIPILYDFTFQNKSLVNIQRLYLSKCRITEIRANAFAQLSNLVELDLSGNELSSVPSDAFRGSPALRQLKLNGNSISIIDGDAFTHTLSIVSLDISDSEVTRVAPEAFQALSMLESLNLQNNKLRELPIEMTRGLGAINDLKVHGNPWACNCRSLLPVWRLLRKIRMPVPVLHSCEYPIKVRNSQVIEKHPEEEYGCPPEVVTVKPFIKTVEENNTTVVCEFWGTPIPVVTWYHEGTATTRPTEDSLHLRSHLADTRKSDGIISSLIISDTYLSDAGKWTCEAMNVAGKISENLTLDVKAKPKLAGGLTPGHVAGIAGGSCLIIIIMIILILLCRRSSSHQHTRSNEKQHNNLPSGVVVCASPNPIQKPPRLTDLSNAAKTDPDLISHLANGYPLNSSNTVPGDYTRVEGDSLYPSGIWDETKTTQAQSSPHHEHFNPAFKSDSPLRGPDQSTPGQTEPPVDPKVFGYPSDYGLPMPEIQTADPRVSTSLNPQLYDSRQELALYNSSSDIYIEKDTYHQQIKHHNNMLDHNSPMYEMMEVRSPKTELASHPSLHDSGHQDASPGSANESFIKDRNTTSDGSDSASVLTSTVEHQPWESSSGTKSGVPMGIPVLPPLPNGTLHRIKPRDSPDEGYQEGTEV